MNLVVAAGPDIGMSVSVPEESAALVGRAPGSHLVLRDPRVSRQHLEVQVRCGLLHVRVCPGASNFELHGALESEATLRPGDEFVVGETRLRAEATGTTARPTSNDTHGATTLLAGKISDLEGFAAVFALSEALERVEDGEAFREKVTIWAKRYIPARETTFRLSDAEDPANGAPGALETTIREESPGHSVISLPATVPDGAPLLIEFTVAAFPREITGQLRRLLLIAARLCAATLGRIYAVQNIRRDNVALRTMAVGSARAFLGISEGAERVAKLVPRLAASDASLLVEGETGTGKSFVARLIHEASPRAREPFRVLNCAAIPESLIEAELFGHEKGAFTGAVAAREGAFESAGRGTLFLDEIGELPLASQGKLLRALEERRFERVGSNRTLTLHARVLAATNRNLVAMAKEGRFRSDLYYRLAVVVLPIAPLRERADDLILLARHLLSDLAANAGRRVTGLSPKALETIRAYTWPGNVRELRNALEHAITLGEGPVIEVHDLPPMVRAGAGGAPLSDHPDMVRLPANLKAIEARAIDAAMRATAGNMTRAAALLGVARATLYNKLALKGEEDPGGD